VGRESSAEIARGTSRWLDDLYQSNHASVFRVCSSILRNPEDAADATQQVFLIALESMEPEVKGRVARGWLLTVARNHCLDLLRRRKRLGKALVTLGPDRGTGTDMETAVADRDFVDVVFKQLSKRERQALWQSAVESRPLADIASRLQLSYMAAAQVLHRARRRAVQAAGRVAVVFGVFHLGRQRPGAESLLGAHKLAALASVAAVPLIAVSMNSSSPARPPAPAAPAVLSVPATSAVPGALNAGTGALSGALPGLAPNPDSVLPGSGETLNSALDTVSKLVRQLESATPAISPPPIPSLPAPTLPPTVP
jgi:RNA polymerase sigma-70 factor (ECF subfamily)